MRRRSNSPRHPKDADLGRRHWWKRPSGIHLKILLFTSGQEPISILFPRGRTRRRGHDSKHSLHANKKSRDELLRHPAREATILHNRNLQSDGDSITKAQRTLGTPPKEYRGQAAADLSESNYESDTESITSDEDLEEDLGEESERYHFEENTHQAFEEDTTKVPCPKLEFSVHLELGNSSDTVTTSKQEVIHPEDAKNPAIPYFEDDSDSESDLESNVDSNLEPYHESNNDSDNDSDKDSDDDWGSDSDNDSDLDSDAASITASEDEDIETPLKTSISALGASLPKAGTTLHKDFRPGDIAKVALETCSSCPKGKQRNKWRVKQHERKYHRGQKHYLVIYNVIPRDDKQGSIAKGFTCTSLSDKKNVSSHQMEARFLRLEGDRNEFWSSIKNGERVISGEKAHLLIQGPEKMRLATYVERKSPKSFPVGQLRDFNSNQKSNPSRHQLEPESLELLLERTTRS